jgi:hypothetical protein
MRRIVFISLALVVGAMLVVSCASGPKVEKPEMSKENKPTVIDDVYHGSRATPDWIFLEPNEMEGKGEYKDVYLFKFVQQGQDVDGLRIWVRGFAAASEIARMVSTRVQDKFVGAAAGDKDKLETYLEEVVKSVSEAQFSGARKAADYWWQIQKATVDGNIDQFYEYYLLWAVPRDQIDQAIKRALDDAQGKVKPKSEDEQTARDRVKAVMEQGLD